MGGTGAGDAFDAGYIAGLLNGDDPSRCLEWGSALGASCVRSIGATESVFTRDEALEFMREHPLEMEALVRPQATAEKSPNSRQKTSSVTCAGTHWRMLDVSFS